MKLSRISLAGLALVATLSLGSCSSNKAVYLSRFNTLVENVEADGGGYNLKQWKKANSKYNDYMGDDYKKVKDKLTLSEQAEVAKLATRYRAAQVKYSVDGVKQGIQLIQDGIKGVGEFINGLGK